MLFLLPMVVITMVADQVSSLAFQPMMTYPTGMYPTIPAVADFNGDGYLDVVVSNNADNTVSVFLGSGSGDFATGITLSTGTGPTGVASADFNNDNHQDIAVANFNDNTVSVLLGDGNGNFAAATPLSTDSPYCLATADFNSDNHQDIAVTNANANTISVFLGSGNGNFATGMIFLTGINPSGVVTTDFNNDNHQDIAVSNFLGSSVSVLLGDGNGNFTVETLILISQASKYIATADFNNDTHPDIVVADQLNNIVSVRLGNGNGTFSPDTMYPVDNAPLPIAVGDLNNDNYLDIAVAHSFSNTVSVILGNGNGGFSVLTAFTVGNHPFGIIIADFNNDGNADIAVTNLLDNTLGILLNTAPTTACRGHSQSCTTAAICCADLVCSNINNTCTTVIDEALAYATLLHPTISAVLGTNRATTINNFVVSALNTLAGTNDTDPPNITLADIEALGTITVTDIVAIINKSAPAINPNVPNATVSDITMDPFLNLFNDLNAIVNTKPSITFGDIPGFATELTGGLVDLSFAEFGTAVSMGIAILGNINHFTVLDFANLADVYEMNNLNVENVVYFAGIRDINDLNTVTLAKITNAINSTAYSLRDTIAAVFNNNTCNTDAECCPGGGADCNCCLRRHTNAAIGLCGSCPSTTSTTSSTPAVIDQALAYAALFYPTISAVLGTNRATTINNFVVSALNTLAGTNDTDPPNITLADIEALGTITVTDIVAIINKSAPAINPNVPNATVSDITMDPFLNLFNDLNAIVNTKPSITFGDIPGFATELTGGLVDLTFAEFGTAVSMGIAILGNINHFTVLDFANLADVYEMNNLNVENVVYFAGIRDINDLNTVTLAKITNAINSTAYSLRDTIAAVFNNNTCNVDAECCPGGGADCNCCLRRHTNAAIGLCGACPSTTSTTSSTPTVIQNALAYAALFHPTISAVLGANRATTINNFVVSALNTLAGTNDTDPPNITFADIEALGTITVTDIITIINKSAPAINPNATNATLSDITMDIFLNLFNDLNAIVNTKPGITFGDIPGFAPELTGGLADLTFAEFGNAVSMGIAILGNVNHFTVLDFANLANVYEMNNLNVENVVYFAGIRDINDLNTVTLAKITNAINSTAYSLRDTIAAVFNNNTCNIDAECCPGGGADCNCCLRKHATAAIGLCGACPSTSTTTSSTPTVIETALAYAAILYPTISAVLGTNRATTINNFVVSALNTLAGTNDTDPPNITLADIEALGTITVTDIITIINKSAPAINPNVPNATLSDITMDVFFNLFNDLNGIVNTKPSITFGDIPGFAPELTGGLADLTLAEFGNVFSTSFAVLGNINHFTVLDFANLADVYEMNNLNVGNIVALAGIRGVNDLNTLTLANIANGINSTAYALRNSIASVFNNNTCNTDAECCPGGGVVCNCCLRKHATAAIGLCGACPSTTTTTVSTTTASTSTTTSTTTSATCSCLPSAGLMAMSTYNVIVLQKLTTSSDIDLTTIVCGLLKQQNSAVFGSQLTTQNYPANSFSLLIHPTISVQNGINVQRGSVGLGCHPPHTIVKQNNQYIVDGNNRINLNDNRAAAVVVQNCTIASICENVTAGVQDLSTALSLLPFVSTNNFTFNYQQNKLTFNVNTVDCNGVAVFTLAASAVFGQQNLQIQILSNTAAINLVVINLSGRSVTLLSSVHMSGNWLGNDYGRARTIWNLYEAVSLKLDSTVHGALLAPKATVAPTTNQAVYGVAVLKSFSTNGGVRRPYIVYPPGLQVCD